MTEFDPGDITENMQPVARAQINELALVAIGLRQTMQPVPEKHEPLEPVYPQQIFRYQIGSMPLRVECVLRYPQKNFPDIALAVAVPILDQSEGPGDAVYPQLNRIEQYNFNNSYPLCRKPRYGCSVVQPRYVQYKDRSLESVGEPIEIFDYPQQIPRLERRLRSKFSIRQYRQLAAIRRAVNPRRLTIDRYNVLQFVLGEAPITRTHEPSESGDT